MQRLVGSILSFVGAFLLVAGLMAQVYAPGQLEKTPLDVDSFTKLAGQAELADGTGGTDQFPVKGFSTTLADTQASTDEIVVFKSSSCLVKAEGDPKNCVSADDPQGRLLTASTDTFATDRVTAEAVNDPDVLPASASEKQGLINKWPFDAQQKTYPYWDGVVGEAVDAEFDRQTNIDGETVYVYAVDVTADGVEITDGVTGTYTDQKEIYIEPVTGSIVKQVERQERVDGEGNTFLAFDLAFTPEQVQQSIDDASSSASALSLVTSTLPLIGYLVGFPLLLVGLVLLVLAGRRREPETA